LTGVTPQQFAPLAVVSRSGVDESVHFGALVALQPNGEVSFSIGDQRVEVYPRSSTKPFQALAMVRNGLTLSSEQLALVCASHNGENIHLETARQILRSAGLSDDALLNTADFPLHVPSAHEAIRRGDVKSSLQMNCSGKHSGMLATCVHNGWPLDSYLDVNHPLQLAITETITETTQREPLAIGIDGCGAPAHVVELVGLARAMRAIAVGDVGSAGTQVFEAMSQHSYMVGGDGRHVTTMVSNVPGLFAKDGAESVYVAATKEGHAVALKLSDGSGRATPTVLLAALRRLGVDVSGVPDSIREVVLGHGHVVGEVRAVGIDEA
jgi:L-asparaginase II